MIKEYAFFEAIKMAEKLSKGSDKSRSTIFGKTDRATMYRALSTAHPFVFDRSVSENKLAIDKGLKIDLGELVKEFSLPFKDSLYIIPPFKTPAGLDSNKEWRSEFNCCGFLIKEITPEEFDVWTVNIVKADSGREIPWIDYKRIDLKNFLKCDWHVYDDLSAGVVPFVWLTNLTNAISVKRIGIERSKTFSLKAMGKYISIKRDNIIHIADKVEYEYSKSIEGGDISWNYQGFWRGHWRAFYIGEETDHHGRRVVDYSRKGKNRLGEYIVDGYTWVKEHIKGDKELAEIKNRLVKAG